MKRSRGDYEADGISQANLIGGGGVPYKLVKEDSFGFLNKIKGTFQLEAQKYRKFLHVMKEFEAQRIDDTCVFKSLKKLFKGHDQLIVRFNMFCPKGYNISLTDEDEEEERKKAILLCTNFVENVQKRFQGNDMKYKLFLDILELYREEDIKIEEVYPKVYAVFKEHSDLMEEFKKFYPKTTLGGVSSVDVNMPSLHEKVKVEDLGADRNSSKSVLLAAETLRNKGDKSMEQKHELDGAKEKNKHTELDLSKRECLNPSYRLLTSNDLIPKASGRSALGLQVLNDQCVYVTSGSENSSFKHRRISPREEMMFRFEDDRFELDLLLESVKSTAKKAKALLNSLDSNSVNPEIPIRIKDHFTAMNLRCIERLYGDQGLEVMDILHKKPYVALPVILTRLKQKKKEWKEYLSDFNEVWSKAYESRV